MLTLLLSSMAENEENLLPLKDAGRIRVMIFKKMSPIIFLHRLQVGHLSWARLRDVLIWEPVFIITNIVLFFRELTSDVLSDGNEIIDERKRKSLMNHCIFMTMNVFTDIRRQMLTTYILIHLNYRFPLLKSLCLLCYLLTDTRATSINSFLILSIKCISQGRTCKH